MTNNKTIRPIPQWIYELTYTTTWNNGEKPKRKFFTTPEDATEFHTNYTAGVKKRFGFDHRILEYAITVHKLDPEYPLIIDDLTDTKE